MKQLPSLNAIKTFAVAARLESFTAAAQELHVTQGAVSRILQALQEDLGVQLFMRSGRAMLLTTEGRNYFEEIHKALEIITSASNRLRKSRDKQKLSIVVNQGFATKWIIPRLSDFQKNYPHISLSIIAGEADSLSLANSANISIRYGLANNPGYISTKIPLDTSLTILCSPFIREKYKINGPEDLIQAPLLAYTGSTDNPDKDLWKEYFSHFDLTPPNMEDMPRFYQLPMLAEAALCGLGFIIVPRVLFEKEIFTGNLIEVFSKGFCTDRGYFITHTRDAGFDSRVDCFKTWVIKTAKESLN